MQNKAYLSALVSLVSLITISGYFWWKATPVEVISQQPIVEQVSTTSTALSDSEKTCMDLVQGKVKWSVSGRTDWKRHNLVALCKGTTNPQARIACFQSRFKVHETWQIAIGECLKESS